MTHSVYTQGYEQMRRHAIDPGYGHTHHGFAVMVHRGVADWLQAFTELPVLPDPVPTDSGSRIDGSAESPMIDIVVAMVREHIGRVAA